MKIPPFWEERPELWFAQIEAQFRTSGITTDETKFSLVVGAVESRVLSQAYDAIIDPPEKRKYDNLKQTIIERFGMSKEKKLQKLLTTDDLGDQTPSQILNELRELGGPTMEAEMLKLLWLNRLPTSIRSILVASKDEIAQLAVTADRILEMNGGARVNVVKTEERAEDVVNQLKRQIEQLSLQMQRMERAQINEQRERREQMERRGREEQRVRSEQRGRYDTNERNNQRSEQGRQRNNSNERQATTGVATGEATGVAAEEELCWYHSVHGNAAKMCRGPCPKRHLFVHPKNY